MVVKLGCSDVVELGSRGIGSSHKMPKLTSADKCLNLILQLEAILSIVTIITVITAIFVLVFSSKGCLQRLRLL